MANFMQASIFFPSYFNTILQIIKIDISKYLLLCMKAGISQIQSQMLITELPYNRMQAVYPEHYTKAQYKNNSTIMVAIVNSFKSTIISVKLIKET